MPVIVKLKSAGIRELARSAQMQRVLLDTAAQFDRSGVAKIVPSIGPSRARVSVIGRGRELNAGQ